jgi:hypothetical protein
MEKDVALVNPSTDADHRRPDRLSADLPFLGCFGLLSLPLICSVSYSLVIALAFVLDLLRPHQPKTDIERNLIYPAILAITLIGLTVGAHHWLLAAYLPPAARKAWLRATLGGATLYWALIWTLIAMPPDPLTGLLDQITTAAGPFSDTVGWVGGGAGILIGAGAGAVLGGLQWRVLRRYRPPAARWWPAALIGGSALLGGVALAILRSLAGWAWMGT